MEEAVYSEMRRLEDAYWWFVGKRMFIFNFIEEPPGVILDLGCGTGAMIENLSRISKNVIGIDNNRLAISYIKKRSGVKKVAVSDARFISMKNNTFDLIIASDLLEHIADDELVLNEINRVLKPGVKLIATVPSFTFLWSKHDDAAHHVRRYNINLLKHKTEKANLRAERLSYTNMFAFPILLLLRSLKRIMSRRQRSRTDFFHTPPVLNAFFIACYKLEAALLKKINFPFGVSILGVFVKH
jgi:ubiquinone/menaquinone biosynthesis C-methylase UbiE